MAPRADGGASRSVGNPKRFQPKPSVKVENEYTAGLRGLTVTLAVDSEGVDKSHMVKSDVRERRQCLRLYRNATRFVCLPPGPGVGGEGSSRRKPEDLGPVDGRNHSYPNFGTFD